ncbi:MAG: uracil-DNA glycosylase [Patescibacteria group bacterium]|nr:uracil-DNA glycosylase [Patescibacteria group bacterium]
MHPHTSTKQEALDTIANEIVHCKTCKEHSIGKAVPGEGSPDARVMFVGEAPGKLEAETGRPFIGRSGKLLRAMIGDSGMLEKDVYITSPVKYLPTYKTPNSEDIAHGKTHIDKQIAVINPQIIVLLGSVAIQAVLGEKIPVLSRHGTIVEKNGRTYFLTMHPAAVLRNPTLSKTFAQDFTKLKNLLAK